MEEEAAAEAQQQEPHDQTQQNQNQVLRVLEALKEASQTLQNKSNKDPNNPSSPSSIKALLELETESDLFSQDPNLSTLSHHLTHLKSLLQTKPHPQSIPTVRSFLRRRASDHEISRVAGSIESEIQAWIDRENVENLVTSLRSQSDSDKIRLLDAFETRISQGFDRNLQALVLKSKVFESLESGLCDPATSKRVRERAALAIAALVRFNKDVFVGQVLMGPTIRALVAMATGSSIRVLCALVHSIKSPLVDDIQSNGEIPRIIGHLGFEDLEIRILAMDLVMEIGYFGRKEAIEAMLEEGLVKKLMELQRSEVGGSLIEIGGVLDEEEDGVCVEKMEKKSRERRWLEMHPFASCVARFAIQLEVGEGLRQREKRAFKQEILKRVREAAISDPEAATVLAEVLWGSSH